MHRMFLSALLGLVSFATLGSAQAPVAPKQATSPVTLTDKENEPARNLLATLLEYVDEKTRREMASSSDPLCLPQRPRIKLSYQGREISTRQMDEFRQTARSAAPSVFLVGASDENPSYTIDILEVKVGDPLTRITYRHSAELTFPSTESVPWFGQPASRSAPRSSSLITSEALIGERQVLTLSRGHLTNGIMEERSYFHAGLKKIEDKKVLDEIGQAIAVVYSKQSDTPPTSSDLLPYFSAGAQKVESWAEDKDAKFVFAWRSVSSDFVGATYTFLLVKMKSGWEVVDGSARSFSDMIMSWSCSVR